ncbi:hypothetical protein RyT2_29510 [Pseudolactococcus yaeyamensis]
MKIEIQDLKQMGLYGNATARLTTGETVHLRPKFAIMFHNAVLNGEKIQLPVKYSYHEIFETIRTVKVDKVLVAKRERNNELKATGNGYRRPVQKRGQIK